MEPTHGQHSVSLNATVNDTLKTMDIEQKLIYFNTSEDTLHDVYLHDWINAYSNKSTPLARRFSEDYIRRFHFARTEEWGYTSIKSIVDEDLHKLSWQRPSGFPDLVRIKLGQPLPPGKKITINLDYLLKIPSHKFTRFGYEDSGNFKLRHWFLTPGKYDTQWRVYSNKDLGDLNNPRMDLDINLLLPSHLAVISALELVNIQNKNGYRKVHIKGEDRIKTEVFLMNEHVFDDLGTKTINVLTNLRDEDLNPGMKSFLAGRVTEFLNRRLGEYPHQFLLASEEDYQTNPVYGLNQLPKFIRPFPDGFNYDLKLFKTVTKNYLENTILLDLRNEKWILDAIQIYLLMEYVNENYPDMKIIGSLSNIIGIRWFHASGLEFNDQYPLLYMHMARMNMDQKLSSPRDSLIKFNNIIANPYKAGVGLKYLEHFLEDQSISKAIKEFYSSSKLQEVNADDFENILKRTANKNINWFFEDYVDSNGNIDYKIRSIFKENDSLKVTIKNKTGINVPIPLYGLKNGKVVFMKWVEDIERLKTIQIPDEGLDRLALNYEGIVPEINQRDNYKGVESFLDKPLQIRLLKDVEDPRYTQLFVIPEFQYNLYDGIALGPRVHNSTFLQKNFEFSIAPLYGFNSQTLIGGASFIHQIPFENQQLHSISYGASGSRFSYGYGKFYERFSPFLTLSFRDPNFRDSKRQSLRVRNINVLREEDLFNLEEAPDYNVFSVDYRYSDKGMVDYFTANADFQLSQHFSKFAFTTEYRKLFKNNRQLNLRFFGGTFLYNDMPHSDYFSFALDRPTDYLFDYNYYGRSETTGLFSQQIIMAEGGFKSQLEPEFANQWLTTVNASTNIWKWIYAYGDMGLVKNKGNQPQFLYDSGIRISFVADYFELFFPVYSNLGWEISQTNYDERIRFIVTLDLPTLLGIFSREWY